MKKMIYGVMLGASLAGMAQAFTSIDELPDTFSLSEFQAGNATSFNIATAAKKLGTLYCKETDSAFAYELKDEAEQLLASARARFTALGTELDTFDHTKSPLGAALKNGASLFSGYDIYSPYAEKLAQTAENFWGTTYTLYDASGKNALVKMERPFFRLKNTWTVTIQDKESLKALNIDPNMLVTFLTVHADTWHLNIQQAKNYINNTAQKLEDRANYLKQQIKNKIEAAAKDEKLANVTIMAQENLDKLMEKLENEYKQINGGSTLSDDSDEYMVNFVDYCLAQAKSAQIKPVESKSILYLLQQRMAG